MLFMGTGKYPSENEYSEYMKNNGGYDNAFTSYVNTNYHFECSNAGFVEGLDRFAQFFIEPLFSESGTEREMKAVHSEYKMGVQNEFRRFWILLHRLANEKS